MDADIFNGAADWQPQPMPRMDDPYKVALIKISIELDELPPMPVVKPVVVEDLKKVKKPDLVKAYQSLYAAYTTLTEYTGVIRPTLEVVRDTAEESLLQ